MTLASVRLPGTLVAYVIADISRATYGFPSVLPVSILPQKLLKEHRARPDELANEFRIDDERTHQLPGSATEVIPMFVRTHGVDLVVMGATARWGLRRTTLGSTAERVLDHLACDTLIVRSPE